MSDFHIRSSCRLCASPELEELLRLPATPLANEYLERAKDWDKQTRFPLYVEGCRRCGHVQLPVVVDPKRLFPPDYPYQSGTSAVFLGHLKGLAQELYYLLPYKGRRRQLLDIASNDGTLVQLVRNFGSMAAYGIDPCCPEEFGVRGFFTEEWARGQANKVDVITALNVFAHVDDLDDFTRGVHTLLEPGGLFVVEVGYLPDVIAGGRFTVCYHEHLSYHHVSPLVPFFKRHGMTLVDAHRIDSQGGSVRLFVRNGEGKQSERLRALLDEEDKVDLFDGVRRLSESVDRAREQLLANAPLVLYGAPAKLCTLLHATGMTDRVEYVVDDNPRKVGRYVPGTQIPIRHVAELYERRPKLVMITAWNFADAIKAKHAEVDCEWVVSDG
jgi:hypothetical protein